MFFSCKSLGLVLAASIAALVTGCQEKDEIPVDYSAIAYKFLKPVSFAQDSSKNSEISSLECRFDYRYAVMLGDTLDVTVLEFESDVYALDYYMNSGHFQGSVPILRGNFLEQSFRADKHIFIFRHDSYRRYERARWIPDSIGIPEPIGIPHQQSKFLTSNRDSCTNRVT